MAENIKHLCAPIPEALHTKLREQQEKSGKNLSQYMTWLITQFYENETKGVEIMTDNKRTVAFQVPTELFDEFKAYLQRHNLKQGAFFLDCIQRAIADDTDLDNQDVQQ